MIYKNVLKDDKYRWDLGEFFKDYSVNNLNKEWDYIVGLSYKLPIKSESVSRKKLKQLYNNLKHYDCNFDGIYVSEFDSSFNRLHHHLIVSSSLSEDDFKHRVVRYWKNIGIVDVGEYDKEMEYVFYMTKHINKTKFNNWDILSNL
tara:strand:+ start:4536 stop:4973 length:438 start_codon:yes stop_codon:yes gene_type:complete